MTESSFPNTPGLLQPVEGAVKPGWTTTTLNDTLEKIDSANGSFLKLGEYDFRKFEFLFEFIHLLHVLSLIYPQKRRVGQLSGSSIIATSWPMRYVTVDPGVTSLWHTFEWP